MNEHDTEGVEQTVRIAARPETVWRYWTDPDRMGQWWGDAVLDVRPGGSCRVRMASGAVMRGEYLELVPYERVVFTFGWEPGEGLPHLPPGSTRVEVTLVDDGGDTVLTLRHTGLPAGLGLVHHEGWDRHLPALVRAATTTRE